MTIQLAIVGVGKIARDQHIPTIAGDSRFELVGAVSRGAHRLDVPIFQTLTALRAALPTANAVAICTPPIGRLALVEEALALGFDILLEKPPAATVSEAECFGPLARAAKRALYLSWHSREAAAVGAARAWLKGRTPRHIQIDWLEDVRIWHPGQEWIWSPGIGVFDPGINALSILTSLVPDIRITNAELSFPQGRAAPIRAQLMMNGPANCEISADFSFDQCGPPAWSISIETDEGLLTLLDGGGRMQVDGKAVDCPATPEYARVYDRFAAVIAAREVDADIAPLRLVADAFMLGQRKTVGAFSWEV